MRKIKYIFNLLVAVILFGSCEDEVTPVQPSSISNVITTELPGEIKITWENNEPVNYEYLRITYFDQLEKKVMMRNASHYANEIIIPNTRAKYGEYEFAMQTFSSTETAGEITIVKGTSGPAPKTVTFIDAKPVALEPSSLYTDAPEATEGPIGNLLDGNTGTFFHASWSRDYGPLPHYIVVDLGKTVDALNFKYITRNHSGAGNHPKTMNIYVSEEFDGTTYDVSGTTLVDELSSLPSSAVSEFVSDNYILDGSYQYVWFEVTSTHGGTKYFALSELSINEGIINVVDPEAPAEGD